MVIFYVYYYEVMYKNVSSVEVLNCAPRAKRLAMSHVLNTARQTERQTDGVLSDINGRGLRPEFF